MPIQSASSQVVPNGRIELPSGYTGEMETAGECSQHCHPTFDERQP